MTITNDATTQQLLRAHGVIRLLLSRYGRLHDMLSDAIEGGRLKEVDLPDDYLALVRALTACAAVEDEARAILRAPDAPSVEQTQRGLEKILEALHNVPVVGQVYDQQHADTHMQAALLATDLMGGLAAASGSAEVGNLPTAPVDQVATNAWRIRAVLHDEQGCPVGMRQPEVAELRDALQAVQAQAQPDLQTQGQGPSETVFVYVQEGGSSDELYLHSFDSLADAQGAAVSCAQSAYRTTPIVEVPRGLSDAPGFYEAVESFLHGLAQLDYAKDEVGDSPEAVRDRV